ncbi:MAG: polymer-forming cytoskeletal protein [Coriobacteriales bacterium]|nr:polymer-forming cytoskeletal protein [Coriobacteriales bacterium]
MDENSDLTEGTPPAPEASADAASSGEPVQPAKTPGYLEHAAGTGFFDTFPHHTPAASLVEPPPEHVSATSLIDPASSTEQVAAQTPGVRQPSPSTPALDFDAQQAPPDPQTRITTLRESASLPKDELSSKAEAKPLIDTTAVPSQLAQPILTAQPLQDRPSTGHTALPSPGLSAVDRQPAAQSAQSSAQPIQPAAQSAQSVKPAQSTAQPIQPTAQPTQSSAQSAQPAQSTQPATFVQPIQPSTPAQPTAQAALSDTGRQSEQAVAGGRSAAPVERPDVAAVTSAGSAVVSASVPSSIPASVPGPASTPAQTAPSVPASAAAAAAQGSTVPAVAASTAAIQTPTPTPTPTASPVATAIETEAVAAVEKTRAEQLAAASPEQLAPESEAVDPISGDPIEAEEEPVEKGISVITREATVLGDIITEGHIDIVGRVKGNIDAKGDVAIHGIVRGDIDGSKIGLYSCRVKGNLSAGLGVIVDDNSIIGGDVKTKNIIFDGKVKGNIDADNVVVLRSHSYCLGDVTAASLAVEPGAVLNGKVRTFVDGDLEAPFDEVM